MARTSPDGLMNTLIDLAGYFERIGYVGASTPTRSTLDALTFAHARSIPFENIDVLLQRPILLTPDALFEKLVVQRRGGYCFEQNGLFLAVLEALGFNVMPISARVRIDRPRTMIPPRTHLFLRVELDGESWLTDVGVGALSLTAALRLLPNLEQPTPHELRRVIFEDGVYYHQVAFDQTWHDVSEFTLEAMPLIDRELANWFTSTHPDSHFKHRLMVARAASEGRRLTLMNDVFTVRERDGGAIKHEIRSDSELRSVLTEHFGIEIPASVTLPVPDSAWRD